MAEHKMVAGGYGHGLSHCVYCSATDREIAFALGPNCPAAPKTPPPTDNVISLFGDDPIRKAHRLTILGLVSMIPDYIEGSTDKTSPANLRWMLDRCLAEINTFPIDKLGRWVGFVQGVLALSGHLDVDAERNRTRPFFHEAYTKTGTTIPSSQNRIPEEDKS